MMLKEDRLRNVLVCLLVGLIWFYSSLPVMAENIDFAAKNQAQLDNLFTVRNVETQINLDELGLENWRVSPEELLTKQQLLELSNHLRDLARYFGTGWPVIFPLSRDRDKRDFVITDFKKSNGNWNSLTIGYALSFVTEELQALEENRSQPVRDFLVRVNKNNRYQPLVNIPLSRYCYELFKWENKS